ncbi:MULTISPECIES: flagellar biosynthesis protein FlhA [unclassified Azospirillum]|uniref:flagellar biosynthesis protein FlhA n=1 Tax=unclassified Azospirillum TaxID=2630922 RepID=UPI000B645437|nr:MULTISPECIES: flagellar biosynthesis protein FlhA [unclassified Azospirillum]SNS89347.1 flagellar biosynthesis protein FlhA [Azospirillum sp. RU38E]SNT06553.1 flagellar biosynthesis protein FlhA [Azospirillum sp. RU37A]
MTDQPQQQSPLGSTKDALRLTVEAVKRGEVGFALGILTIVVVLIIPLPTFLLDVGLTISFGFSILILMVVLSIQKPLEFSSFPTILLVSTMLRLSLNLASTRLILGEGHNGAAAAGHVIQTFGNFIMGGNFIIGVTVFGILMLVNFSVITKGSGRIAEVAARFTLDAMPGKQMAIDADLSAGLIDEGEARRRRKELEDESQFFGAMDGASKFVRGDAVAGLVITFLNIIVGMIIGIAQKGMSFTEAGASYTLLTVGDGLVSQIPALLVSLAAGLMVSKSGSTGSTDKAVVGQLTFYPTALGLTAAVVLAVGMLPGMPKISFGLLAIGLAAGAYFLPRSRLMKQALEAKQEAQAAAPAPAAEEPIATALAIDLVRLELGYGLLSLINTEAGHRLTDQIKGLRRQLAGEIGIIMPAVRIQDNLQLPPNTYLIRIKEIEAGRGDIRPNMLLCMDPRGDRISLPGEATTEPTFGLPAMWIDMAYREEALFKGYTVVDPPTVLTTHLTEVIKDNMADLLSYAEMQKLLDEMGKEHQKLVADVVPGHINIGGLQRVMQNLLGERVSVRDLPTILEGVAEATAYTRNMTQITEHVRARLARQISDSNTNDLGYIPLVTLSPEWEQAFAESIVQEGDDRQLAMAPSRLQQFITAVRQTFEKFAMQGEAPVLLTSPAIRPFVRSIIERFRPATVVMSQNEIHPKAKIKTLGQI